MNPAYDINQILADLEQDIMKSYQKNMAKHTQEEIAAGFKWDMWQAKKLQDLKDYRSEVKKMVNGTMSKVKPSVADIISGSHQDGMNSVDDLAKSLGMTIGSGGMNTNKLDSLINAVHGDMDRMGASILRLTDDKYRQILFKTQFAYTSGSMTMYQAIDQASKDFLSNGINSIQYSDGKKVNIASYAEMAVRSASKQAYLTGEGSKLDEWGIHTVQVTSYGACSDTCLPWQGRIYIDDVYSSGKPSKEYPLLSSAISDGLYHPNCRHTHGPFFEGISTLPKEQNVEKIREQAQAESQQRYIERQIRQYKRVEEGSLDDANKQRASIKVRSWQKRMRDHLDANPQLRRAYNREKTHGVPNKPTNFVEKPVVNKPEDKFIPIDTEKIKNLTKDISWTDLMNEEYVELKNESRRYVKKHIDWFEDGTKFGHSSMFDTEEKYRNRLVKESKKTDWIVVQGNRMKAQMKVYNTAIDNIDRDLITDKKLGLLSPQDEIVMTQQSNILRSRLKQLTEDYEDWVK